MRKRHFEIGCLPFVRILGVAAIASLATACSSDALRLSETPFANPFQGRIDSVATNSADKPIQRLKSSALSSAAAQPMPARTSPTLTSAVQNVTASPVTGSVAGWTATGGTSITVGAGDTIDALSARYGVPSAALRAANGLSSGQPSAGQKLIIPAYNPGGGTTRVAAATQSDARAPRYEPLSQPAPKAQPKVDRAPRYEPLPPAAAAPVKAKPAVIAAPKQAQPPKQAAKPVATPARPAPQVGKASTPAAPKKVAKTDVRKVVESDDQPMPPKPKKSTKVAAVAAPKAAERIAEPKSEPKPEATETTAAVSQEFRWPARGRVISGYGSKGPGGANDGINIALPEGTPVKAAEAGTVAYAGEEIKGYGKMVLIRHPNGYVSAYAHNGDLAVKKGDVVKRGQQIARSGQTGNVTSPQLHFELRKGSDPVDPAKFLD